ncbi:MAG: SWIM zinc finger family protein, partial [Marinobacter sp.]
LPLPGRLISAETRDEMKKYSEAGAGPAMQRNIHFAKTGHYLAPGVLSRIEKNNFPQNTSTGNLDRSHVSRLVGVFEEGKNVPYMQLVDKSVKDSCRANENVVETPMRAGNAMSNQPPHSPSKLISVIVDPSPDDGGTPQRRTLEHSGLGLDQVNVEAMAPIAQQASHLRSQGDITEKEDILMCMAWVVLDEVRIFKRFPEVVYCDATSDTTATDYFLVSFSARTPEGKAFIFLRVWAHNQKRATFHWIFNVVVPNLIGVRYLQRTQIVLVDGDRQQQTELHLSLEKFMRNATIGTCARHLVQIGYDKNARPACGVPRDRRSRQMFKDSARVVLTWLYSFMLGQYSPCETELEYKVSKAILFSYLQSPSGATAFLGSANAKALEEWIRDSILINEDLFLHCRRSHLRHYWQATTSPHEGTNHGLKAHAAKVGPNQSLEKSARNMLVQTEIKTMELQSAFVRAFLGRMKWSNTKTSGHVSKTAESILIQQYCRMGEYTVGRISQSQWQVYAVKPYDPPTKVDFPIPKFRRVRSVTFCGRDGILTCSCCQYQSVGIPCVHIACVLASSTEDWTGFVHHDLDIAWWTSWHLFAYNPAYPELSRELDHARQSTVFGPRFRTCSGNPPQHNRAEYDKPKQIPISEMVGNYPRHVIQHILHHLQSTYNGLTQETNKDSDEEERVLYYGNGDDESQGEVEDPFVGVALDPRHPDAPLPFKADAKSCLGRGFWELVDLLDQYNGLGGQEEKDILAEVGSFVDERIAEVRGFLSRKRRRPPSTQSQNDQGQETVAFLHARPKPRRTYHSRNVVPYST